MNTQVTTSIFAIELKSIDAEALRDLLDSEVIMVGGGDIAVNTY